MATDATGTPTALGIPKFNTSVDAPSGLGSNAQMDSIDALIQLRAPLASPALTGAPTAPTQITSDATTKIATTAFVQNFVAAGIAGVTSFNGRTGVVAPTTGDYAVGNITGAAPLASPALTGTPTAPTPGTSDNTTTVATTAYVKANLTSYATLASPTFTGVPLSVTPATADNTTKIATTAYVKAQGYGVGTLTSFNGRGTAAVVPTTGDYTAAQVTNAFDKSSASVQVGAGGYTSSHTSNGIGYSTGAGGTATQATSFSTGVTLNSPTGQITLFTSAISGGLVISFTLTNSSIAATDTLLFSFVGASNQGMVASVSNLAAGSAEISWYAPNALPSATRKLNFTVIKGATS